MRSSLRLGHNGPSQPNVEFITLDVQRQALYFHSVIKTFRCKDTERLHRRERVPRFLAIERVAQRKLRQLDSAVILADMASPPGNRLETLTADRQGQHSVRINDQWRLCFRWIEGDAYEVEIVDYH